MATLMIPGRRREDLVPRRHVTEAQECDVETRAQQPHDFNVGGVVLLS